jgi:hypothetical protein
MKYLKDEVYQGRILHVVQSVLFRSLIDNCVKAHLVMVGLTVAFSQTIV